MEIRNIYDKEFRKYGRIVANIDFSGLLKAMKDTPVPQGVVYEPWDRGLKEKDCCAKTEKTDDRRMTNGQKL